jgi:hypothetical protein
MEEGGGVDSGSGGAAQRALAPGTQMNGCSSAQLLPSSDEARHWQEVASLRMDVEWVYPRTGSGQQLRPWQKVEAW